MAEAITKGKLIPVWGYNIIKPPNGH